VQAFTAEVSVRIRTVRLCPEGLMATIDPTGVHLTWANPDDPGEFDTTRVLRRLNTPPEGPDDPMAVPVALTSATSATDDLLSLLPDLSTALREYHYAAFACSSAGQCGHGASSAAIRPTLVQVLRGGGYNIHFRHATANVCADNTFLGTANMTTVPDWWKSCDSNCGSATARQLGTQGVGEATAIGSAFRDFDIPVGRVLSSEFCRCLQTAALMDLGPQTETDPGITFFVYEEAQRCTTNYLRIGEMPFAGGNTVIIGHAGFPEFCPVIGGLGMGEAAIFKPDGTENPPLIARVLPSQWAGLAVE
jgi:hypothetical protein